MGAAEPGPEGSPQWLPLEKVAVVQRVAGESWRKRVGIEPTAAGISRQPDGFEGRASHQTRIASTETAI